MTAVCPDGHATVSTDYCDVCGAQLEERAPEPAPAPADPAEPRPACPNCGTVGVAASLFCETCGYDFTTGSMPAAAPSEPNTPSEPSTPNESNSASSGLPTPPMPANEAWVAELWIDPDWYAEQNPEDPMPSTGLPALVPLRSTSLLVGRPSRSRGINPQIDCGADSGVSRRHCQLSTDGQRWWVEDLQSANGTYVCGAGDPVPTTPIPAGQKRELTDGDHIYVGGWTRLVIRKALPGEV